MSVVCSIMLCGSARFPVAAYSMYPSLLFDSVLNVELRRLTQKGERAQNTSHATATFQGIPYGTQYSIRGCGYRGVLWVDDGYQAYAAGDNAGRVGKCRASCHRKASNSWCRWRLAQA